MGEASLIAKPKRRRVQTKDSEHALPVAENLLGRRFSAEGPDVAWATDSPTFRRNGGKSENAPS